MAWNGSNGDFAAEPGFHAHTAYLNTPLEAAVRDFLGEYASLPRTALYWPFGNESYASADGWHKTDAETLLWADNGALRWRHPKARIQLVSPPELALNPKVHRTLVFGTKGRGRLRTIGVEYVDAKAADEGWQVATKAISVSALEKDRAGWVVPLTWPPGAQPEQIRLLLQTGSQGEMVIEQIAILPTG
jgi:hypothetical protein